ncbi:hypothetical protein EDB81DRAFT_317215 [Dactylonectria macrodidyma]|uniref:Uncharacterized protein n=1 Tax=Dactylonectria macrodidyma TaxID=307937 RepID=A0A9P9D4P1_9HYPO|nr:hypothetical protein EDB81DRAFT_317215 [Dactylonectria macrodidyma]
MPDRITKKLLVTANASSAGLIIYFSSQVPSPWMSRGVSIAWVVWISTGAVLVWVYDAFLRRYVSLQVVYLPVFLLRRLCNQIRTSLSPCTDIVVQYVARPPHGPPTGNRRPGSVDPRFNHTRFILSLRT